MRKTALLLALIFLCAAASDARAYDKEAIYGYIVDVFKDIEAVFSWHVEDRKTLKEVAEETTQGILS